jgi:hypothetical protein
MATKSIGVETMLKYLLLALFGLTIFAPFGAIASAEDDLSGFTLAQLNAAIAKSGVFHRQKIYSILTFDSDERRGANLAILSASQTGWYVTVLHRVKGGLKIEWRSDRLPNDIAVSSSNNLKIETMDDGEQVVEFSGCAALIGLYISGPVAMLVFGHDRA